MFLPIKHGDITSNLDELHMWHIMKKYDLGSPLNPRSTYLMLHALLDGCVLILRWARAPLWIIILCTLSSRPQNGTFYGLVVAAPAATTAASNFFHGARRLDEMGSTDMYAGVRHPSHSLADGNFLLSFASQVYGRDESCSIPAGKFVAYNKWK